MPALKRLLFLAAFALVLSGCYLPVKFDAEIEVDGAGYYSMIFDGYLAQVPLYEDLVAKKLTTREESERVAVLRRDFMRDSAVTEFEYLKQGIFKVHWEKRGDLLTGRMITFVRRNEAMLTLKYIKTSGLITVSAGGMSQAQRQQVLERGLNVTGEMRVLTDATVISHNATFAREVEGRPGWTMYVWRIENALSPSPLMKIQPG